MRLSLRVRLRVRLRQVHKAGNRPAELRQFTCVSMRLAFGVVRPYRQMHAWRLTRFISSFHVSFKF